jgi:hypothetical protein
MTDPESLTPTQRNIVHLATKYFGLSAGQITLEQGVVNTRSSVFARRNAWEIDELTHIPIPFGQTADFWVPHLKLTDLTNCPHTVLGEVKADGNRLTNLVGGPSYVTSNYIVTNNPLESLEGLPHTVGGRVVLTYQADLPLLRLLLIKECKGILIRQPDWMPYKELNSILDKYLGKGMAFVVPCARELIKHGFAGNARL